MAGRRVWAVASVLLLTACVPPPGGGGPEPPTYAALGDSYSSGDGAGSYDAAPADCRRSAVAWPRLIDGDVALLACSGADVVDLASQIPAGADTDVTLVTLTIGGNDAGFGEIFQACLLGACPSPSDPAFVDALSDLTADLGAVYGQLASAYPSADIVHVGYPRLTPPAGDPVGACFWLTPEDQVNAAGLVDAINAAIASAVAASSADVDYVDVSGAFAGHELCTPLPWVTLLGRAHPNAAGQQALAAEVAAAL